MPAVATPQGTISNLGAFNQLTRRNRRPLTPVTGVTGFGQVYHQDLLQVGYLESLDIIFKGSVDVTAQNAATANVMSPYFPYNLINQIALRSNEGLEIYRTRGYTNHVINSLARGGVSAPGVLPKINTPAAAANYVGIVAALDGGLMDPWASDQGNGVPLQGAVITAVGTNGVGTNKVLGPYASWTPGTATASTIKFTVHYRIPVAADRKLTTGAILLQNQATRLGLDITTCNVNDWFLGTSGVNFTSMTNLNASIAIRQNFFSVPADAQAQPDTSFIHRWIEDQQVFSAAGDNQILIPVNGVIQRVLTEVQINAGASQTGSMVPYSAADGAGLQPAVWWQNKNRAEAAGNLGNVQTAYAGSSYPEQYDAAFAMIDNYLDYGMVLPDGMLLFDYDLGAGFPELGFNGRDVYDTSSLTQFTPVINWAGAAPPAGSKIWYAREELQRRA